VPRIGKKYEVKDVADGYGRHLIASKVAEPATPKTLAHIEQKQRVDATSKQVHKELLSKSLESLDGMTITLYGKANEKGHLFASIHKDAIMAELKRATRIEMNPDYVVFDKPLKELGIYEIPVLIGDNRATFTAVVEAGE